MNYGCGYGCKRYDGYGNYGGYGNYRGYGYHGRPSSLRSQRGYKGYCCGCDNYGRYRGRGYDGCNFYNYGCGCGLYNFY